MSATLRNVPKEVTFLLDAKTIEMGSNFTFDTSIVGLDVLGYVEPIGGYDDLLHHAETFTILE